MYANRVELNEKNMLSIFRPRKKRICLAPTDGNFVFAYSEANYAYVNGNGFY